MPHYLFYHKNDISDEICNNIAKEVTDLHCTIFPLTPKFFVNVFFRKNQGERAYCGGSKTSGNRMIGHVRNSAARSRETFNQITNGISEIWEKYITDAEDKKIRIWIIGGIVSGKEEGFLLPIAGEEKEWIQQILPMVHEGVDRGEEHYKDILDDIQSRGLDKP